MGMYVAFALSFLLCGKAYSHEISLVMTKYFSQEEQVFSKWMNEHDRAYSTQAEHEHRLGIFLRNLQKINKHNAEDHSWQMGLNKFSDMTFEEFQQKYIGAPQNCSATNTKGLFDFLPPPSKDWRKEGNYVTPVKNQLHCGSCWTFSSTGCLESATAIHGKGHPLYTLSEQQLVDCAGNFDDHGCNGGLPSHAFEYIKYNHGLMSEVDYPYTGKDGKCKYQASEAAAFVKDIFNITMGDETSLKNAVGSLNPVSVAFQVTDDFMHYKSGIYSNPNCGSAPSDVNHAVLAVGYDTDTENKPYWIIKNSWGTTFGLDGYFHIERGSNMCGLATCASYPIIP